jgi:hypothetical protein
VDPCGTTDFTKLEDERLPEIRLPVGQMALGQVDLARGEAKIIDVTKTPVMGDDVRGKVTKLVKVEPRSRKP